MSFIVNAKSIAHRISFPYSFTPSIRVVVYKNGIRTTEFFRDHDKLRSGIITENQVGSCSVHEYTVH